MDNRIGTGAGFLGRKGIRGMVGGWGSVCFGYTKAVNGR